MGTTKRKTTRKTPAAKKKPATKPAAPQAKVEKPISALDAAAKIRADSPEPLTAKAFVEAMAAKNL